MGAVRTTQRLLIDRVLNNLNHQQRRILALQEQLATGQIVNRPSDDSLATRRAISARTEVTKNEQFLTNISNLGPGLRETETSLTTLVDVVQRARELTLQGANGTNSQLQLDQIAIEVNQLLESTLVESNHVSNGRYIFGGTVTKTEPFVASRDANDNITGVGYIGNEETFQLEIQDGILVDANEPGSRVFTAAGVAGADVFQTLIDIRDNLRAGDTGALQDRLGELSAVQDQLLISVARVGSIQNRVEQVDSNLQDINLQLLDVISDNIDADYAETIVELNAQSNALEASLNAGARVIQPSLLNFLS
jgi:flagellar hook-associated protein 3 FlgL